MRRDGGYISSETRPLVRRQQADCGWRLAGQPGQRVQLTLAAFGGDGVGSTTTAAETEADVQRVVAGGRSGTCNEVGSVWDGDAGPAKPLVICGPGHNTDRRPTRHTLLFLSETSSVVIRLKSASRLQHLSPFVIKYKGSQIDRYLFHTVL